MNAPTRSPSAHPLLALGIRRLRAAFSAESVDNRALWWLASEGMALWTRQIERALGDHLDDRLIARQILTKSWGSMLRRRLEALPASLRPGDDDARSRALMEALYPGPVARAARWTLDDLSPNPPGLDARLWAWKLVTAAPATDRWLEVSSHLGELLMVLLGDLKRLQVPRAVPWLGDVCFSFGMEVGELAESVFSLPSTPASAIETLRMGELLFRVNPEHLSSDDGDSGYIEGNACLWVTRPGWAPTHCGVLGRFQAGVAEVFGLRYTLENTIPKNGGSTCRIALSPILRQPSVSAPEPPQDAPTGWRPPTRLLEPEQRRAMMQRFVAGRDPAHGLFGPDSLLWEGTRESVLMLGGGRAALMQLAHPAVAHAIRDHSVVHQDMLGRFMRTMLSAYSVLFGSTADALGISDRVHRVHSAIAGTLDDVPGKAPARYHALDADATFWVGATLFDTSMEVFERMVRPFSAQQRDQLVREAAPFWGVFGVPIDACPGTWVELCGYVDRQVEALAPQIGETARRQAELLFHPRGAPFAQPAFDQLRRIVAELLPAPLRRPFGMTLGVEERLVARTWLFAAERLTPRLPLALRYVPNYHQAQWRLRHGWGR